ncbi:DUF1572 family protein [Cyclobacterium jeungdonense]|uniref:DUF1572 family protein n=1 Tax=Cyclobacterium jeungdonense TaxID=708087 RepID=A0ABT8C6F1_9BACT|nr:DUF1572 family protein [Cyclobacterium jeungdonense]MDN3687682.1 DUF1572 family protein [Cyclobacterium jeungdonense]
MDHLKNYLDSSLNLFRFYKSLGEKALEQVADENLFWQHNADSNSMATIVKHMAGNMHSRWTDFLESDGEKPWRNRDGEFENDIRSREEMMQVWEEGWKVLFAAIEPLAPSDFEKTVYIQNKAHTVMDAINRQLTHYASHVGQLIYLGKMLHSDAWQSLSVPKGQSKTFSQNAFRQAGNDSLSPKEFPKK